MEEVRDELYRQHQSTAPTVEVTPASETPSRSPSSSGSDTENKKHSMTTKQTSSERHKKRRETLAKLGLTTGFGLGVTGENGQVGTFAHPRASDPEVPKDYMKSFVDGQEKLLRRLSRMDVGMTSGWDLENDHGETEDDVKAHESKDSDDYRDAEISFVEV
jgi:hypothetical protein